MRIIWEPAAVIAGWAGGIIGCVFMPPYTAAALVDEQGKIRTAVVFNNWNNSNIDVSVASTGFVHPKLVAECGDYVFRQLKCRRASLYTRPTNQKAIRALEHMGAKFEARIEDYFPDADALLYRVKSEDLELHNPANGGFGHAEKLSNGSVAIAT